MGTILKAKDVLDALHEKIELMKLECGGSHIKLTCVRVGDDSGTDSYISSIKRVLSGEYGIDVEVIVLPETTGELVLIDRIEKLNMDSTTSGIMLMRPVPEHIDLKRVQNHIAVEKDVDGVNELNIAKFWTDQDDAFSSCTAQAALYMLKAMVGDLRGLDVVVVGRSREVGRPIAELLVREDATVTICHSATDDLSEHLLRADAVVSCVGMPHLIDGSMLKEGAYVVDVGMSMRNGMLVGDVDIDTALEKVSYITPVMGGLGVITTHMLALHTIKAQLMQA